MENKNHRCLIPLTNLGKCWSFREGLDHVEYGIWRFEDGNNNFAWAYYSGISPAETIVSADSNVIYLIDLMNTPQNIEFRKLDFSNPSLEVWFSQMVWSSWTTTVDYDLYYDSDLLSVYVLGKTYKNLFWSFVCLIKLWIKYIIIPIEKY